MLSAAVDPAGLLKTSALFGGLLDEDYELLLKGLKPRTFATGDAIFWEHDEGGSAFLIVEGCVSIERTADSSKGDAETVQIAVRGPGEFIGELSMFDDVPRNADARAIEPTSVLQLRGKHVMLCAQQSPELALSLLRGLAGKLREATDRRTKSQVANVRDRLLGVLADEARLHGIPEPNGTRILLNAPGRRLTQTELGLRANCDRAVVNRTLAELFEDGLVEKDRDSILLRQWPRLKAVAGTLLCAARETRAQRGPLCVPERLLRGAPKLLGTSLETLQTEIDRLAAVGLVHRAEGRIDVCDEAGLARVATGGKV